MLSCWVAAALFGQAPAPAPETAEVMVDKFFRQPTPPNPATHYTKKMASTYRNSAHLGGRFVPPEYSLAQQTVFQDAQLTLVSVHVEHLKSKSATDYYVFLQAEGGRWKFDALRQFFVPPAAAQVLAVLSTRREKLSDEENSELTMIRAFTTSDADLEARFRKDEDLFEALAKEVAERGGDDVIHSKRRDRNVPPPLWEKVRKLELYYVQLQRQGWIECTKSSLGPAAVGYLWVHPRAEPPRPSPDSLIYLKKLTPQWYAFRRLQMQM